MFSTRRRHLVVHPAHRAVGVSRAPIEPPADCGLADWGPGGNEEATLCVALIAGPVDDASDRSAELLAQYLECSRFGSLDRVCCQVMGDGDGLDRLDESHCAVLFLDRGLPSDSLAALARFGRHGRGIVGLRAADGRFLHPWAESCAMFGAECRRRHACPPRPDVEIAPASTRHPIVVGVQPFTAGDGLARTRLLAADAEVLLTGWVPGAREAVAWTYSYQAHRGFCTTLGHPADFRQPSFLRLLANAIFWTAGRVSCG